MGGYKLFCYVTVKQPVLFSAGYDVNDVSYEVVVAHSVHSMFAEKQHPCAAHTLHQHNSSL